MLEFVFILAFGIDDVLIVSESWRTDKHVAVLFDESCRDVLLDFVSSWFFRLVLKSFLHCYVK